MEREDIFKGLFVVAIVLASLNVIVIFNNLDQVTGKVTETGSANLTVESLASINFTTNSIEWGSGIVDSGESFAYLDTHSGTVVNGNWTANSAGLVLENIGNMNVTLVLSTGLNGTSFLGGTNPDYEWNISESEASSCTATANYTLGSFVDVNFSGVTICSPLNFADAQDVIRIDINLSVPSDAFTGFLEDTITATATAA